MANVQPPENSYVSGIYVSAGPSSMSYIGIVGGAVGHKLLKFILGR